MQSDFEQEVNALNSQVVALYVQAKYPLALEAGLHSYELARAHLADTHPALISSVNNLAGVYRELEEYEKAEEFYLRGLELRRAAHGDAHREIASSLNNLASLYRIRGMPKRAERCYVEALDIWRATVGEHHPEYANTLSNLAHLYHIEGDYDCALPLSQQALTLRQTLLGERNPAVAVSLNNLAMLYTSMGTPLLAQPLLEQSLAIRREAPQPSPPAIATALTNLASFFYLIGSYDQAEPLYREALTVWRSVVGTGHTSYITTLSNLALIYHNLADNRRARALWRRAIIGARNVLGEQNNAVATSRLNLGLLYFDQGNLRWAKRHILRALAIRKAIFGKHHPELAHAANALGLVYYRGGDYQRAEKLFRRAVTILQRSVGADRDLALVQNNLGALLHANGAYERAATRYREALALLESLGDVGHPRRADMLYNLARTQWMMGDTADAVASFADATSIDHQTMGILFSLASERQRMGYLLAVKGRLDGLLSLVLSQHAPTNAVVRTAMNIALRRKGLSTEASVVQRAAMLYGRHPEQAPRLRELRALDSQIARAYLDGPSTSDSSDSSLFQRKLARWKANRDRLEAQLAPLIREVNLARRLASATVESVAEVLPPDTALVEYVRYTPLEATSPPGHLTDEFRSDHYAAIVVPAGHPDQAALMDLGAASLIDAYVETVRSTFGRPPGGRGAARKRTPALLVERGRADVMSRDEVRQEHEADPLGSRFIRRVADAERSTNDEVAAAQALRRAIFDPVEKGLSAACRALIISPDGDLNLLPLGILPLEGTARLVDKYSISYVGAGRDVLSFGDARLLPVLTQDYVRGASLVIADPDYDLDERDESREPAGTDQQLTDVDSPQTMSSASAANHPNTGKHLPRLLDAPRQRGELPQLRFQRLPGTRQEGIEIARLLHVHPLLAKEAVESHIKSAQAPRILHIATHGFFLSDQQTARVGSEPLLAGSTGEDRFWRLRHVEDPLLRSGLAFAGANTWLQGREVPPTAEDGLLTARDVLYLDLEGTDLVTLSACETGVGQVHVGEGVFGLRRAFTQAGAKTLVMSLWRIPDVQTRALMSAFYERLLSGVSCVEALRAAQLELRQRYPDPYYWGAFICSGAPDPLFWDRGSAGASPAPMDL